MVRISEQVISVLNGNTEYESLDDTGRSVISLHLYLAAKKLCAIKDREQRHAALATLPPSIQPLIKLNAIKIWNDIK